MSGSTSGDSSPQVATSGDGKQGDGAVSNPSPAQPGQGRTSGSHALAPDNCPLDHHASVAITEDKQGTDSGNAPTNDSVEGQPGDQGDDIASSKPEVESSVSPSPKPTGGQGEPSDKKPTEIELFIGELQGFELSTQDILTHLSEDHARTVSEIEHFGEAEPQEVDTANAMHKLQLNLLVVDHKIMLETQKLVKTGERLSQVCAPDFVGEEGVIYDINEFLIELESDSEIKHLEACVNDYETQLANSYDDALVGSGDGSKESKLIETIGTSVPNAMIDAVVRNTTGPINSNITCFVNRFLFAAERPSEIVQYSKRHNKQCKNGHLPVYLETDPGDVRLFIEIMAQIVFDHCSGDYECTIEEIETTLENYIFPQIYQQCMKHVSEKEEDQFISEKCREYSYVTQSQIFISQAYQSSEVVPFIMPISKLRTMFFQLTPSKKLYTLFSAAQSVVATIDAHHKGRVLGGDDFLPIWIYVVLHANAHEQASTIAFIREYANPALMQTELGYYFSSLELAVEFIKALSPEKLNNASPFLDSPFLVFERERCKRWAAVDRHIDMIDDHVTLKGYRMFVVEEWIGDRSKFSHVIITVSDDPEDVIHAAAMKANEVTTSTQQHFLESVFYRPPPGQRMRAVETEQGIALVCDLHLDKSGTICSDDTCTTTADGVTGGGDGESPLGQRASESSAVTSPSARTSTTLTTATRLSEVMAESPALEERFRTVSNMSAISGGRRSRSTSNVDVGQGEGGHGGVTGPSAMGRPSVPVGRHTDADLERPPQLIITPSSDSTPTTGDGDKEGHKEEGETNDNENNDDNDDDDDDGDGDGSTDRRGSPQTLGTTSDNRTPSPSALTRTLAPQRRGSSARLSISQPVQGAHPLGPSPDDDGDDTDDDADVTTPKPVTPAVVATPQKNILSLDSPATTPAGTAAASGRQVSSLHPDRAADQDTQGKAKKKKHRKSTFSSTLPPVLSLEEFAISTQGHEDMAPTMMPFEQGLDFGGNATDGFHVGSLEAGFLLPVTHDGCSKEEIAQLTFLPIPDGDYDQYARAIQLQLQLRRVGCGGDARLSLAHPHEAEEQFRQLYSFYVSVDSVTLEAALRQLVVEVQTSLAHLDFFDDLDTTDAVYSTRLVAALSEWQKAYNLQIDPAFEDPENLEPLSEDGTLNPATLTALRRTLSHLRDLLQHEGFMSKDPIRHGQQFQATVRSFQEQRGIAVSGKLDRETRLSLFEELDGESTVGTASAVDSDHEPFPMVE